uniref:AN1-type domain-containing protein n=1 Tax=Ditylenchus dipsaci TaxID=166011 RepID=A0A915D181_9BILA
MCKCSASIVWIIDSTTVVIGLVASADLISGGRLEGSSELGRQFLCSFNQCFAKEYVRMDCSQCNKNYCLKHRLCEEHDCESLKLLKAEMHTSEPFSTKQKPYSFNKDTKERWNLMKMPRTESDTVLPFSDNVAKHLRRRLRPIYDAIDAGQNKKAIQEADKVLKKHPTTAAARALKALALIRTERSGEAWPLINALEDEVKQGKSDETYYKLCAIALRKHLCLSA